MTAAKATPAHTTTPRTDAALAYVAASRERGDPAFKHHDELIKSHVALELDNNALRADVRAALGGQA